jgi:hypothetical protein
VGQRNTNIYPILEKTGKLNIKMVEKFIAPLQKPFLKYKKWILWDFIFSFNVYYVIPVIVIV